jgi:hypothetical protein
MSSPVAGFRLASGAAVCRECPRRFLMHPIARIIPAAQAAGVKCSACGARLTPAPKVSEK